MSDEVLQPHKIAPVIPASEFVPDPALSALYKQAVATARQFGWLVPEREDFEKQYRQEVAASRRNQE